MGYSPYAAIEKVGNIYGVKVSKQTMYRYTTPHKRNTS